MKHHTARAASARMHSGRSILSALLATLACAQGANATVSFDAIGVEQPARPQFLATNLSTLERLEGDSRPAELSDDEYFSYSGVGAVSCIVDGVRQTSTAFLVGSFDLAVTVAHTFEHNNAVAQAADCVYTSTDSSGQIRERIPVAYYKSQWIETAASGTPAKDLAVLRLQHRSTFAYRTLPLGKFSGAAAPVTMIGFSTQIDSDTFKRKSRGTVYERDEGKKRARTLAIADIFTHDMDAFELASGAPVLDERNGVIIGIHTSVVPSPLQATAQHTAAVRTPSTRNALITMNQWLESTLRDEIARSTAASASPQ